MPWSVALLGWKHTIPLDATKEKHVNRRTFMAKAVAVLVAPLGLWTLGMQKSDVQVPDLCRGLVRVWNVSPYAVFEGKRPVFPPSSPYATCAKESAHPELWAGLIGKPFTPFLNLVPLDNQ